jgi:hypothetical protein
MLRKLSATMALLSACLITFSQTNNVSAAADTTSVQVTEEPKKPALTITGSADLYYRYDFKKQADNNRTSFTGKHNSFALGMASVKFEHAGEKVGVVADLGFGPRAEEFNYTDEGLLTAVKQLYVTYSPSSSVKLTAGTWATHVGYELLDPQLNRNYSMSYLFTNGPFSHTGLKAEVTKGKHAFMVGISNPTDYRVPPTDLINKKFFIAQYALTASDAVKLYFNYVGGKGTDTSIVNQYDFVGTATVSSKFSLGLNATLNRTQLWDGGSKTNLDGENWWGVAGYFNFDPKSWLGLTFRSELFNDDKGMKGFNTSIFANTLSANFKVEGFTFIPELRIESAGKDIYFDENGSLNQKTAASFILAAVYKF